LLASSLAGFLWFRFGGVAVFSTAAAVTAFVLLWLWKQAGTQK
jgi:hypothetical protein